MLWSLFFQHPEVSFNIYVMHTTLTPEEIEALHLYIERFGHQVHEVKIEADAFQDAPILMHYSKEMYYRLLAFKFLPETLDKILYLDPDILVINRVDGLYNLPLNDYLYAAAHHRAPGSKEINQLRLNAYEMEVYYNSGVLLMNLEKQRREVVESEIYAFVQKNKNRLILPDQDVLNVVYCKRIQTVEEVQYNYDARYFNYYKLFSNGEYTMDYVMKHTAILHFCGKKKPWHKGYTGKFHALYKHYEALASR
jgi:lipopolysaccharide biosynthesis glycosyltransferase